MSKQRGLLQKSITIVIIILLSSICFTPLVYATNLSDDILVEIKIEFCGLGRKHTVKLSQKEANEVNDIFESIGDQLNNVISKQKAKEIFKDAIVKLHPYGLFGNLNIEQTQRLVLGDSSLQKVERGSNKSNDSNYINKNCLVYLSNEKTNPGDQYILLLNLPRWLLNFAILPWAPINLWMLVFFSHVFIPVSFRGFVWISGYNFNLKSFGLNGYVDTFIGSDIFLNYFTGIKYQYGFSNGGSPSFAFDNASLFGYARKVSYGSWW
jgi:hypothetical protein